MSTMTQSRRASDHGEPTNAELMAKLEGWINEHRRDHSDLERRLATHDQSAVLRDANITSLLASDKEIKHEVDEQHDFRVEVKTYGTMLRFVVGASLLQLLGLLAIVYVYLEKSVTGK